MSVSIILQGFKIGFTPIMKPLSYTNANNDIDYKLTRVRRIWFGVGAFGFSVASVLYLLNAQYFVVLLASIGIGLNSNIEPFINR